MGDLFDGYGRRDPGPLGRAVDEVFAAGGLARPQYEEIVTVLSQMSPEDVSSRAGRLARAFMDQGVTFDLDGEERPFPLDVMPRVFAGREWDQIAEGVAQRVRALEAFLADIYNAARILQDGVIPYDVVTSSPGFLRAVHGVNPTNGVRIHVAGIDVVRDEAGELRVLEDNIRCPSGVSYVLANRAAMARVLPEVFWGRPIHLVADYPARLVRALRLAAPGGVTDPTVVVLTPGVYNSAFYEHALLARLMGVHLAEGRDLVCHGTDVFLRTTEGEVPVHVVYRRVDDDYIDPLQFRPDSLVGCPGLLNAARAGRVTVANAVGNGIADDKLVYSYVPDMIRYYLDEDPVLQNVETFRLTDDDQRAAALRRRRGARLQASRRVGGQRPRHRAVRHASRARRDGGRRRTVTPVVGRPTHGRAVDVADVGRRWHGLPARRLPPVRGQRRRTGVGPPRWPDAGGPAGGWTGRQLQPGRRLQGHLGRRPPGDRGGRGTAIGGRRPGPARRRARSGRDGTADGRRAADRRRTGPTATVSNALLSRVAESTFWVGRYVERAEGTARILDVIVYQALEQIEEAGGPASARLLAVMGLPPDKSGADLWQVTERLARDPSSRSSIAGAINAARENTRAVRHVIPVELWERINGTWAELPHQWELARRVGPASYLAFVKMQTAAITGLADTTMSRDQTWLFFTLGRCLERTDVVARQLASLSFSFDDVPDSGLVMLLRSCGGYEPYLRLSQGVVGAGRVLDFLLRDRLFPRSAFASLTVAEDCLAQISMGRSDEWDEARGLIGLARAELEYSPPASLAAGLDSRLERLQRTISQVSDAVTRRYFAHDLPTQWRSGAGS